LFTAVILKLERKLEIIPVLFPAFFQFRGGNQAANSPSRLFIDLTPTIVTIANAQET